VQNYGAGVAILPAATKRSDKAANLAALYDCTSGDEDGEWPPHDWCCGRTKRDASARPYLGARGSSLARTLALGSFAR
jgi:hypothetical protein